MDRLLEATARAEREHFWFRGFRRFVEPLVAAAAAGRRPDIIDCGCGTGHNLALLERYGHAYGIDLTWAGLQYARARGERRVARGPAARLPFADARFGLATSFDVLYSLPDEVERDAIAEMFRVLDTWRHADRERGRAGCRSGAITRCCRARCAATARAACASGSRAAGFRVTHSTYTNFSILPMVAAVRLKQRSERRTWSRRTR